MKAIRRSVALVMLALAPVATFAMEWHWLDEMRSAIQHLDYQGEYLHRRGDDTSVYSIAHSTRDGQPIELLRQLDGEMIEVLRRGNRLDCYYPKGAEDLLDNPVPAAPFSQTPALDLEHIAQSYRAQAVGEARVAGLEARIVSLTADEWRYPLKLWLDKSSGLLLQSEIRTGDGTVLEQFRYTRLTVGEPVPDSALEPTLVGAQARQQTLYRPEPEVPDASGFRTEPAWLPDLFKLIMAEQHGSGAEWMEKRVYSDGLATFSIFVEPGRAATVSEASMGATSAVFGGRDGLVITVIGEIPPRTAMRLLESLSRVQ